MDDDQDIAGVMHWAKLITDRKHAGAFARKTPEEKRIVERGTAEEWAQSVAAEFGIQVERMWQPDADPPDMIAEIGGRKLSVELVELVDQRRLQEASSRRRADRLPPTVERTFELSQWDELRFRRELGKLLDRKQSKYRSGEVFDFLVVHSDEPWLRAGNVRGWLDERPLQARRGFHSAYLLLTYDPNEGPHWPVFRLW